MSNKNEFEEEVESVNKEKKRRKKMKKEVININTTKRRRKRQQEDDEDGGGGGGDDKEGGGGEGGGEEKVQTIIKKTKTSQEDFDQYIHRAQQELLYWVEERQRIYIKKEVIKEEKPWTDDFIFLNYRFCNVCREDDKVTRWLFTHWYQPQETSNNLAFAACVARHFNWPDTLEVLGFPHEWNPKEVKRILKYRRDKEKKKIYTGAYIIPPPNEKGVDKIDYSVDKVLTPIYNHMRNPEIGDSLESFWLFVKSFAGFGSFLAGQVVADLKFFGNLKLASDWNSFAPLGPGSIRGLNRYHMRSLKSPVSQSSGLREIQAIQDTLSSKLGMKLAVHNVQNCLCEYDKYMRLKYDCKGRVRAKYNGNPDS